jgi:protein SCO1/2
MDSRTNRLMVILIAFSLGLAICLGGIFWLTGSSPSSIATHAAVGGPFKLTDQDGKPITDKDMHGKPFLVFFGFTHCPDICPTTLFDLSEVMRKLGPDADKTAALFITVDPERDTPATMKDYLSSFDPHVRGVTGDPAAIAATAKAYRVYYKKVPTEGSDYTMDHTAIVYLMDKNGDFVAPFNLRRRPEESAKDLRHYF